METTGVSGENRNIWGETGVFKENRVYGDNGDTPVFSRYSCFL
jgi:hypothetical protein